MAKRTTEEAIENLSDAQKMQLIKQYEQFEKDGHIGNCELRTLAKDLPGCGSNIVVFMKMLAHECYRYFSNRYINRHPAGMKVVTVESIYGHLVAFPVDEFQRCDWSKDNNAYRVGYDAGREVMVCESNVKELIKHINMSIQTTVSAQ